MAAPSASASSAQQALDLTASMLMYTWELRVEACCESDWRLGHE